MIDVPGNYLVSTSNIQVYKDDCPQNEFLVKKKKDFKKI